MKNLAAPDDHPDLPDVREHVRRGRSSRSSRISSRWSRTWRTRKLRYVTPGVAARRLAGAELAQGGRRPHRRALRGRASGFPHLLTGEVDLGSSPPRGRVAKLRPLAVFATGGGAIDVPTVAELGSDPALGYGGLFVRAGTPAAIVARLEAACREATADQTYQDLAEKQFQQSSYLDREAFTARLDADYKSKAALIPTLKLPE
jgi:hypothetical protein